MKEYKAVDDCRTSISAEKNFIIAEFRTTDGEMIEFGVATEIWPKLVTKLVFASIALEGYGGKPPASGSFSMEIQPKNVPLATVGLGQLEGETILTVGAGPVHIPFRIELAQLQATLDSLKNQ